MVNERGITIQGQMTPDLVRDPTEVLANAQVAAKALVTVISQKKHPVIMNGEQYLEFEDWQTAGQFYGYSVQTEDAVPVEVNGVQGAKAKAKLISLKTGEIVGGAEAYCMRDEDKWNTRPKYEYQGEGENRKKVKVGDEPVPWYQLASMAQTRAGAKAFRNRLAWVVVLAGYKTTPAEEMTGNEQSGSEPSGDVPVEHWCEIHKIKFFKSKKMNSYAHPYEENGEKKWCNEPSVKVVDAPPSPQQTSTEQRVETPPVVEPPPEPEKPTQDVAAGPTDLDKLLIEIELHKPALRSYKNKIDWLKAGPNGFTEDYINKNPGKVLEELKKTQKW
jgi:hypothetical protein